MTGNGVISTDGRLATGARYAVGDIHGCIRTLRTAVEDVLRLEHGDVLYLLGDYIDRGPDSKGVLDYLMSLRDQGYTVRPLMGNHEQMALDSHADPAKVPLWYGNEGKATVDQFGVQAPGEIPLRYIEFMAQLPTILVEDDYILVHAGLDFRTANPVTNTARQFLLWERETRVQAGKLSGRTLICGHTMTPLFEIEMSVELGKPVICLDNGCYAKGLLGFGNLVALNLETRDLFVVKNCE